MENPNSWKYKCCENDIFPRNSFFSESEWSKKFTRNVNVPLSYCLCGDFSSFSIFPIDENLFELMKRKKNSNSTGWFESQSSNKTGQTYIFYVWGEKIDFIKYLFVCSLKRMKK